VIENTYPGALRPGKRCMINMDYHRERTMKRNGMLQDAKAQARGEMGVTWLEKKERGKDTITQRMVTVRANKATVLFKLWFPNIEQGSRVKWLGDVMLRHRATVKHQGVRMEAAEVIQRNFRVRWHQKYKRQKILRGFKAFGRVLSRYVTYFRLRKYYMAAKRVLSLMQDVGKANHFNKTIKAFIHKTRRIQRAWRRHREWRDFVCTLWSAQFEEVEKTSLEKYKKKIDQMKVTLSSSGYQL